MRKRARRSQRWRPTVFKRWAVLYLHDGAPVDGALFIHKAKAIELKASMKSPEKYRVAQVEVYDATPSA